MSDLKPGEGDAELNERARRFAALLAAHSIKASADGDAVTTAAGAVVRASGEPWGSWVANGISSRDAFRALESALEQIAQDADHAIELTTVRRTLAFDPKPAAPAPNGRDYSRLCPLAIALITAIDREHLRVEQGEQESPKKHAYTHVLRTERARFLDPDDLGGSTQAIVEFVRARKTWGRYLGVPCIASMWGVMSDIEEQGDALALARIQRVNDGDEPAGPARGVGFVSAAADTGLLTADDLDNLRHALGFRNGKPPRDSYRNYYCCQADDPSMRRLEAHGFMRRGRQVWFLVDAGSGVFFVTDAGLRAVGCTPTFIRKLKASGC
jgi:hypothetical protein